MAYFNGKRILNARVEGLYETGYAEGERAGYADGYTKGEQDGYVKGETEGYAKGEADGKTAEWNTFWDCLQQNGNRKYYANMFASKVWNDETFKPKYDIVPEGGGNAFGMMNMFYTTGITDLAAALERQGVTLDTSKENVMDYAFGYSDLTHIPTISLESATTSAGRLFYYNANLKTIDKVITHAKVTYTSWFTNSPALENITFEGEIANNLNVSPCTKLTHDSLMSIITHLATVSTTKTLTLGEANLAKLTDAEKAIATEKGWTLA